METTPRDHVQVSRPSGPLTVRLTWVLVMSIFVTGAAPDAWIRSATMRVALPGRRGEAPGSMVLTGVISIRSGSGAADWELHPVAMAVHRATVTMLAAQRR